MVLLILATIYVVPACIRHYTKLYKKFVYIIDIHIDTDIER